MAPLEAVYTGSTLFVSILTLTNNETFSDEVTKLDSIMFCVSTEVMAQDDSHF